MHFPQRDQRIDGCRCESPMTGPPPLGPGYMTGTKHQWVLGHGPTPAPSTIPHKRVARNTPTQVHGASGVACDAGVIWPLLSTGAPRTGEEKSSFRVVRTGLRLTASLTAAGNFPRRASACRCTKHLSKGRPTGPQDHDDCESKLPRPRNSSVPPQRPFKAAGSTPRGVPVRFWLKGRAATRRTIKAILQAVSEPVDVPGANPSHRGPGHRRQRSSKDSKSTTCPRIGRSPVVGPSSACSSPARSGVGTRRLRCLEGSAADRRRPASQEAKNRLRSKTSRLRSR